MTIGFIGQGWIGRNYANDFEARGYKVVRYALEEPYKANKTRIKDCDLVFIAVPTPTTRAGFDDSTIRAVLPLVGKGKIAIIKSTIIPGTTDKLQKEFPSTNVFHSPEFLVEKTAAYDAAHPSRNIIGVPKLTAASKKKAETVLAVLPPAPYAKVMSARDAEFVKYAGNCFLYTKVIFMNLLHDVVTKTGGNWQDVREAVAEDARIGKSHTEPIHESGRGAGGHCFIKDFEAFRRLYEASAEDPTGHAVLAALKDKNIELLTSSKKDLALLEEVYGNQARTKAKVSTKKRAVSRAR